MGSPAQFFEDFALNPPNNPSALRACAQKIVRSTKLAWMGSYEGEALFLPADFGYEEWEAAFKGCRESCPTLEPFNSIWEFVGLAFKRPTRLVILKKQVNAHKFRTPNNRIIYEREPEDPTGHWLDHRENGVIYRFPVDELMFSKGNTSEKSRMSKIDGQGQILLDCFAGIGYYTLPMIIHCRFDQVFACEWNPVAVSAFKASLKANAKKLGKTEVSINRSDVRDEDFGKVVRGICHRVILGLLPSSRQGWDVALLALRPEGGLLHVHENASDAKIEVFTQELLEDFQRRTAKNIRLSHRERVKSYASGVGHYVFDLEVS